MQLAHEKPCVLDPGSARHACPFKDVIEATPRRLLRANTSVRNLWGSAFSGLYATLASDLTGVDPEWPDGDGKGALHSQSSLLFLANKLAREPPPRQPLNLPAAAMASWDGGAPPRSVSSRRRRFMAKESKLARSVCAGLKPLAQPPLGKGEAAAEEAAKHVGDGARSGCAPKAVRRPLSKSRSHKQACVLDDDERTHACLGRRLGAWRLQRP